MCWGVKAQPEFRIFENCEQTLHQKSNSLRNCDGVDEFDMGDHEKKRRSQQLIRNLELSKAKRADSKQNCKFRSYENEKIPIKKD
jgi:hypothetical protein